MHCFTYQVFADVLAQGVVCARRVEPTVEVVAEQEVDCRASQRSAARRAKRKEGAKEQRRRDTADGKNPKEKN